MNPNNACHLCLTAAAGTELAVASFVGDVSLTSFKYKGFFPTDSSLQPEGLHPARGVA